MKEIIPIAEKLGYRGHLNYLPLVLPNSERISFDPYKILEGFKCEIFFDHEFLKVWFNIEYEDHIESNWKYHVKFLVLQKPENRKEYLMKYREATDDS